MSAAPVPVAPVTPIPAPAQRFDVTSCRGCGAAIIWALSSSGKRMPLDADPVTGVNGFVLEWRFDGAHLALYTSASTQPVRTSHFATCPDRDRFRRRA